ncbi:MAG: 16S rRNA (cytosine(1402)-N(4))-methyltransferase RsmH, partial [Gammaproteobacteria bacterium]|nr:16S rRNA (cytosine(1402)-N(4))-methyltransferase RsmH [Gammaproteobacteria bacterium]
PQIKTPKRGFSFNLEGPLDMRMDTTEGITAGQWLNHASVDEIEYVLRFYGEEPQAKRVARAIVSSRPLLTTKQLVRTIAGLAGRQHHPATCTFLAIRLFINKELEDLSEALDSVLDLLKSGGRLAVIAFHSLEDRIVKQFIKKHSETPAPIRGLPTPQNGIKPIRIRKINHLIRPSDEEIRRNPRARSARLRVAEKL